MGKILEPYRDFLLGTADRDLADDLQAKHGASDLVQETFLEAVRGFARFEGRSPDELQRWLKAILGFRLIDFARRYRHGGKRQIGREVPLEGPLGSDVGPPEPAARDKTPRSNAIAQEEALHLWIALEAMPERDSLLLRMRDQEGLPFAEIGSRLGLSADAARKAWLRALRQLRQRLNPQGSSNVPTIQADADPASPNLDQPDDTPLSSSSSSSSDESIH
jgi:RNA polymerase sigma-70 factor (ECF subfamily)